MNSRVATRFLSGPSAAVVAGGALPVAADRAAWVAVECGRGIWPKR